MTSIIKGDGSFRFYSFYDIFKSIGNLILSKNLRIIDLILNQIIFDRILLGQDLLFNLPYLLLDP
jgi:hypothetical protein